MKLTKIRIENFRSIKSETINLDYNCLILLGKNEAGKSNILKAIACVFGEYVITSKDKRKRIDNEIIKDYYVRCVLKLDEDDFEEILNTFHSKYEGIEFLTFQGGKKLNEFIKTVFHEMLIQVDLVEGKKPYYSYWEYKKNDFLLENDVYESEDKLNIEGVGEAFNLKTSIFNIIKSLYQDDPYRCLYWNYDNNYLLPSNVDIAKFIANPSDFKSLNNLFILCNREKVKEEFEMAIKQDGDYENLLEQVSKTVTSTFRGIWADFKDTSIQLRPNGSEISIKVANKAKYTFEDRSDGFKKFISVLLMISTKARSNMIGERDIILIDEPDQSLYPTSARFLKEELLKISEKAKLIYSTHSQYMIDSTCIDRHIIVEKKNDITTAKREDRNASFSNDELLRQAVGSSIFECLKDINLIFEGWLDKELFIKYCEYSNKTKDYSNIGIVYLGGISGVETLVQLLILANKKFIIVSDADETSKKKKIDFVNNYKEYAKSWLSYAEIDSDITTMEDFIISSHIENQLKTISPDFIYDSSKNAISNIETAVNKEKELKQKVKNDIITTLDKNHIKPCYDKYLEKLNELKTMI